MARTVLNLKRQLQEIALTDEENSPVYTLNLADSQINAKARELYDYYLQHKDALDSFDVKSDNDANTKLVAEFYQSVIETLLGKKAFQEIVAYIKGTKVCAKAKCDDIILLISPLVMYLVGQIVDVLAINREDIMSKYLGGTNADTII